MSSHALWGSFVVAQTFPEVHGFYNRAYQPTLYLLMAWEFVQDVKYGCLKTQHG